MQRDLKKQKKPGWNQKYITKLWNKLKNPNSAFSFTTWSLKT